MAQATASLVLLRLFLARSPSWVLGCLSESSRQILQSIRPIYTFDSFLAPGVTAKSQTTFLDFLRIIDSNVDLQPTLVPAL